MGIPKPNHKIQVINTIFDYFNSIPSPSSWGRKELQTNPELSVVSFW